MADVTLEELLKSGAHFGHKASRWNPKMAPYIFAVRNKFHIINLEQTQAHLLTACQYAASVTKTGGVVLFVGTKRQARDSVKSAAIACGMPFVVTRWLGGTLTNFRTIQRSIKKLGQLEELLGGPAIEKYTKKEQLILERQREKNSILFEGIRSLKKIPEAIFLVDTNTDAIAVREARAMNVKVIGIVDTNSDPSLVDCPIPANDDAVKTIELILRMVSEAIAAARPVPAAAEGDKKGNKFID